MIRTHQAGGFLFLVNVFIKRQNKRGATCCRAPTFVEMLFLVPTLLLFFFGSELLTEGTVEVLLG